MEARRENERTFLTNLLLKKTIKVTRCASLRPCEPLIYVKWLFKQLTKISPYTKVHILMPANVFVSYDHFDQDRVNGLFFLISNRA